MARRTSRSNDGQNSMFGSLISIVGSMIALTVSIALAYFLSYAVEGKVIQSYTDVMNYTQNTSAQWLDRWGVDKTSEFTDIRGVFTTGRTALALIAGFLGLILLVIILKGYIMPVLGI